MKQTIYHNRVEKVVYQFDRHDIEKALRAYFNIAPDGRVNVKGQPLGRQSQFEIWDDGDEVQNIRAELTVSYIEEVGRAEASSLE